MKRLALIVSLSLIAIATAFSQNSNVRAAEGLVNQGKDFDQARSLIKQAIANPETANDARTYFVAASIEEKQYIGELAKQQMGKEFDQEVMNKTVVKIVPYMLKADSLDQLPNAKGKVKPVYTKKIIKSIKNAMTYVFNAGVVLNQEKRYAESLEAFKQYYQIKQLPMFASDPEVVYEDTIGVRVATTVANMAIIEKQPEFAIALMEQAEKDPLGQENLIYRQLGQAYLSMGDSTMFMTILEKGYKSSPNDMYFIAGLIDIYNSRGETAKATQYIHEALKQDPNNAQLYIVMGNLYEIKQDNLEEAIKWYEKAYTIDPNDPEINFEYGRALNNQAANILSASKLTPELNTQANAILQKALPMLEKAYVDEPNNKQRSYLLGNVYYRLKMNDKYEALQNGTLLDTLK